MEFLMILRASLLVLGFSAPLMATPAFSSGSDAQLMISPFSLHHDSCSSSSSDRGPRGPRGFRGATGVTGATGATGAVAQSFGRLYASPELQGDTITILNPTNVLPPPLNDWQPLSVDTFTPSLNMLSPTPTNATITDIDAGTYLINASISIRLSNDEGGVGGILGIGYLIDGVPQNDSAAFITIPNVSIGSVFSTSFSDLFTLPAGTHTVQFVLGGTDLISGNVELVTANATITQVGN
jgi:hypothetical protein